MISLLDYGAGNVRSVRNAVLKLGYEPREIRKPDEIAAAEFILFPGVGSFGSAMQRLHQMGYFEPLRDYLRAGRPFMGICIGLQALFEGSDESPGVAGLGIIPGQVRRFDTPGLSVPHMGWNGIRSRHPSPLSEVAGDAKLYFVHSYRAVAEPANAEWVLAETDYGAPFVSAVGRGQVLAVQFHPEKSGPVGLRLLERCLRQPTLVAGTLVAGGGVGATDREAEGVGVAVGPGTREPVFTPTRLAKRIIACLDVRTNDAGDLVVTKGDQYDVREGGEVRNLGKPVELARRYYEEGADEITFLNITAFRDFPLADQPMLEVLRRTSEQVFVPLTIGGGIRAFTDGEGRHYSALEVAAEYFASGADKISIGSDAVTTVEQVLTQNGRTGDSAIEQIAHRYGSQAVVISIDPRRVYVPTPEAGKPHQVVPTLIPGPLGERWCWFQCTVKGGREGRDLDAVTLAKVCEQLGAGEILLNSIDRDGTGAGFDLELIQAVRAAVTIPVIASSGAGRVEHFSEVFTVTNVEAALAAGIFHRHEVPIAAVKTHLHQSGIEVRP
ncbi:MAG: imidazole glycerol phosphate synthase subunit HisF [Chromatiaceae bacterium]|nr:imidazole glycerol phosphate synthase subunit HisF [Candidatus Thioaporhodococcus sediminis]